MVILQKKIKININVELFYVFSKILGLNMGLLKLIFKKFGIPFHIKIYEIPLIYIIFFIEFIEHTEEHAKSIILSQEFRILLYQVLNTYRGKRIQRGLPFRGQRSRSNHMTSKKNQSYFLSLRKKYES
jgi:ribosomal protein S13